VVPDDPGSWLRSAAERAGLRAPAREEFEPALTAVGARFLFELAQVDSPALVERAARELERGLGVEFARPSSAEERARFLAELASSVQARFGE
jgi:hypothetical protein